MARFLDPKNDIPFKRVFGENPDLLRSFLNAEMPFEKGRYIKTLEYLPPELVPDNPLKKDSIVDVRCKDNYDRVFIVEMQMYWNTSFSKRMLFNMSKAYVRQLNINEDYALLQPVYGFAIINDVYDKRGTNYYHYYSSINRRDNEDIIEGMEFVMIELPKFKPVSITEKKMAVLWLRFLQEIREGCPDPAPELMQNKYIRRAIDLCEYGAFTPTELAAYDHHWDAIRRESAALKTNLKEGKEIGRKEGRAEGLAEGLEKGREEGLEKGREEGLEKGREEGLEKGREEGLEKGREEGLEKGREEGLEKGREEGLAEGIEKGLAKGMEKVVIQALRKGISPEDVSELTGLSLNEIHKLKTLDSKQRNKSQ
jgi:predicted transposase/invertase (TIGR01784 family)